MDLQNQVTAAASLLIRQHPSGIRRVDARVYELQDGQAAGGVMVVLKADSCQGELMAGGTGASWPSATMKAVCELGECFAARMSGAANRSGFAGGLLRKMAVHRAKAELIERDAFLYHYRNRVPLKLMFKGEGTTAFRMSSTSRAYHAVLVTDERCAAGDSPCLIFGTGAHEDEQAALRRATSEYQALSLAHRLQPGWCEEAYKRGLGGGRLSDFHHASSRDPRNIAIFRSLCGGSGVRAERPPIDDKRWVISNAVSIIRGFSYVHAAHPDLLALEFGKAETGSAEGGRSLYHPFW